MWGGGRCVKMGLSLIDRRVVTWAFLEIKRWILYNSYGILVILCCGIRYIYLEWILPDQGILELDFVYLIDPPIE